MSDPAFLPQRGFGSGAALLLLPLLIGLGTSCDREDADRPGVPPEPAVTGTGAAPAGEGDPDPEGPIPERAELPAASPVAQRMHERYETASSLLDAVTQGDLGEARSWARSVTPLPATALPSPLRDDGDPVAALAERLTNTSSTDEAAKTTAAMALACGRCHQAADATFRWPDDDEPTLSSPEDDAPDDELLAQMAGHRRAVRLIWEGLVSADGARVDLGARRFRDAPLLVGDAPPEPDQEHPPGLAALEARAHRLAGEIPEEADLDGRARVFGNLLGTCADCHRRIAALGDAPGPEG